MFALQQQSNFLSVRSSASSIPASLANSLLRLIQAAGNGKDRHTALNSNTTFFFNFYIMQVIDYCIALQIKSTSNFGFSNIKVFNNYMIPINIYYIYLMRYKIFVF